MSYSTRGCYLKCMDPIRSKIELDSTYEDRQDALTIVYMALYNRLVFAACPA